MGRNIKQINKNDRFGKLTILEDPKINTSGHYFYNCLCECGNILEISIPKIKM